MKYLDGIVASFRNQKNNAYVHICNTQMYSYSYLIFLFSYTACLKNMDMIVYLLIKETIQK